LRHLVAGLEGQPPVAGAAQVVQELVKVMNL
jgi:hypothetical protein